MPSCSRKGAPSAADRRKRSHTCSGTTCSGNRAEARRVVAQGCTGADGAPAPSAKRMGGSRATACTKAIVIKISGTWSNAGPIATEAWAVWCSPAGEQLARPCVLAMWRAERLALQHSMSEGLCGPWCACPLGEPQQAMVLHAPQEEDIEGRGEETPHGLFGT